MAFMVQQAGDATLMRLIIPAVEVSAVVVLQYLESLKYPKTETNVANLFGAAYWTAVIVAITMKLNTFVVK